MKTNERLCRPQYDGKNAVFCGIKKMKSLALCTIMLFSFSLPIYAAPAYKDVPSTHWAYQSVVKMADMGIIVGDSNGNYSPNQAVDKFSTSKMLAKIAGFKYINLTTEEQNFINSAYEANKTILTQFKNAFPSVWDTTADREIAYLLEKQILTVNDLNHFAVKTADGRQLKRALIKEEICLFLVRLMGKQQQATSLQYSQSFADDSAITAAYKPYVYYLKQEGMISGDTANKFNPQSAVTKAIMAVMLDTTVTKMGLSVSGTGTNTSGGSSTGSGSGNYVIKNISGTIDSVYTSANAVSIKDEAGTVQIYMLTASSSVYVDSYVRTVSDLQKGMPMTGVINNSNIVELRAQSVSTGTVVDPDTNVARSTIEGTVTGVTDSGTAKSIEIGIRILSPRGEITTETRTYALSASCTIKRGKESIAFSSIKKDEVIKGEVTGNTIYSIVLEEKDVKVTGTLLEKWVSEHTSIPMIKVEDDDGEERNFRITNNTEIYRKRNGTIKWSELRMGDFIEVEAQYDEAYDIYAEGSTSTVTGYVENIFTSRDVQKLTVREENSSKQNTYNVITGAVNMYSLRIGSKIKVHLDSQEVESIDILESASTTNSTGKVTYVYRNYFYMEDLTGTVSTSEIRVAIDTDTEVLDSYTGKYVSVDNIEQGQRVFVSYRTDDKGSTTAKTITILSK